jgi:hypothetical protein
MNLPDFDIIEADPVFQLNVMLWSLIPSRGGDYQPILYSHGYFLHSIGRPALVPGAHRAALAKVVGHGNSSPDLLVDHTEDQTMLIVQCKASSFGAGSSTSTQAKKLLVCGSDLSDTVGADSSRPSYVTYATRRGQMEALSDTLSELRQDLSDAGLPSARAGTVAIEILDDGVWLSLGPGEAPPLPLQAAVGTPGRIVEIAPNQAPLPLYIIPWDPGVQQDDRLADFGKALLSARILNETVAMVARSTVPTVMVLLASDLLAKATFDISSSWRAREEVDAVESLLISRLQKWVRSIPDIDPRRENKPHALHFSIRSEEKRSELISVLEDVDEWEALRGPEQTELDFADE